MAPILHLHGQPCFCHTAISDSLLPPSSSYKGTCNYVVPTWIIQNNFLISKILNHTWKVLFLSHGNVHRFQGLGHGFLLGSHYSAYFSKERECPDKSGKIEPRNLRNKLPQCLALCKNNRRGSSDIWEAIPNTIYFQKLSKTNFI